MLQMLLNFAWGGMCLTCSISTAVAFAGYLCKICVFLVIIIFLQNRLFSVIFETCLPMNNHEWEPRADDQIQESIIWQSQTVISNESTSIKWGF